MANPTGKGGFQPGVSGNPGGRGSGKIITDALRRKLTPEIVDQITDNIISILMSKRPIFPATYKEVMNRLEGQVTVDMNLRHSGQASVVLIPSNKREKPLQLMADGDVVEGEYQVWDLEKDLPAEQMNGEEPNGNGVE